MAKRIKGITVEIGGDTTKLQTALKGVNGQIKNTQSALKDVEKLLKLDPTNTTLLAQKQKLLTQAIGETKEKLSTLKIAAQQANEQLQKGGITQTQYDALQREIVETETELKHLESQALKANKTLAKMGEVGEKFENAGHKITNVGKKVTVVSTAVAGMGGATVKTAADFESSMSQVQATMGITKDSMSQLNGESVNTMDALSDLAKEMGSKTAFSASECAEALNYLALAGYNTQEMADTLPIVLNLAAAGGLDLASASDMVTDAMSALGMETKDANKMVDQMAKTASSTNTSVGQLGEGILTIGATAKSIKGGTAELNTALGILANNGIKGAEGGTHLRNVILSLQNPTDKSAKMMSKLGLSVYDSQGNMRSLNDILGDLNTSMDGMTEEEKANIVSKIFNKTDLSSINALLVNTGDTWDDLQGSIKKSSGAAKKMANTQLDNLSGQIKILQSTVESLAISVGKILLPMVKKAVAKLQTFVNWLNSLDEGTKQTIVKIGLFVTALGPLLIGLGKVISSVKTIISVIGFLKSAILALELTNPAGWIAIVVGVATALGVALYNSSKKMDQFRSRTGAVSDYIPEVSRQIDSLSKKVDNYSKKVDSTADSYKELKRSRDEFTQRNSSEFGYYQDLWEELQNIVDVNGKVKSGYEDRANWIASELERVTGTEIRLNKGVVESYDKIKDKIGEVLKLRQAESVYNNEESNYQSAIKEKDVALKELTEGKDLLDNLQKQKLKLIIEYDSVKSRLAILDMYKAGRGLTDEEAKEYEKLTARAFNIEDLEFSRINKEIKEAQGVYKKAKDTYDSFMAEIENYENLGAAILSGDSNKVESAMYKLQNDFRTADNASKEILKAQEQRIDEEIATLQKGVRDGVTGVTQEMVDNALKLKTETHIQLTKVKDETEGLVNKYSGEIAETIKKINWYDYSKGVFDNLHKAVYDSEGSMMEAVADYFVTLRSTFGYNYRLFKEEADRLMEQNAIAGIYADTLIRTRSFENPTYADFQAGRGPVNYTQNIYSPNALDNRTIAMQSKNLLNMMR